jgi:RNA polymerase sigma factor (sigma-70 family)
MTELDDHDLLAEYVRSGSETAFAALAARHVNLVHSAARRFTGNPHHAEEITQAVFVILARKASSLGRGTVLSGWLYQTTRLTAANFVKGEIRRQNREQEAYMQSTPTEPEADAWQRIAPLLDDAMGRLGEADRNAVVLRYFENKSAREVATTLKVTEAAAHKRVNRAVDRLRKFFWKRGVTLTATLLAGAVAANSVQAAPAGLAAAAAATAAHGATISTTLTTLINATMKTMTWLKLKFAAGVGIAALLAGGAATLAISQTGGTGDDSVWTPQEIAKQSQETYAALTSYSDTGTAVTDADGRAAITGFNIRLQRPNLYRIEWAMTNNFITNRGVAWGDGGSNSYVFGPVGGQNTAPIEMKDMLMALGSATGVSSQASSTIPGTFFKLNWGDVLGVPASGFALTGKQPDEQIGGVDCYVFSSRLDPAKIPAQATLPQSAVTMKTAAATTLWIGKQDHLIHQVRQTMDGSAMTVPQVSDDQIKATIEKLNRPATPEAVAAYRTQLEAAMKEAHAKKYVFTQTHENIVVTRDTSAFSPSDFAR